MSNTTLTEAFSDIADAIRAKGVTGTMTPLEMPTKIGSIAGGGSKYGVPIDGLLGDVDQNGQLGRPTETFSFTSNDIRRIGDYALRYKFYGINGLTSLSLPNLTQVGQYGMNNICENCSNLTSVNLPSLTTIGTSGLSSAFYGCTSLTSVDLSSLTTVGINGMNSAFMNCTSLQYVDLSGLTILGDNISTSSERNRFRMCFQNTGLTSVEFPSLTTIRGDRANFTHVFYGCTSLVSASFPELTTISSSWDFSYVFYGCTSLKYVYLPKLSSTGSYNMASTFTGCTSLELVDFSQTTKVPGLYSTSTFNNTNNTFKIIVPNALYESWKAATNWSTYANQIVKANPGLQFNATTAGSTIKLMAVGSPSPVSLKYSVNYGTFSTYTIGDTITLTNVGDNVIFIADTSGNATFSDDSSNYYKFVITGSMSVEQSPEYLLDESGELNAIPDYAFYGLFEDCTGLDNAPPLPNTSLGEYCYASMFKGCTGLTTAPELPATTLDVGCYENMFNGCTGLTVAPTLPAKTVATGCYNNMFYGCSSLNSITLDYTGNFSTTYFDNWVNGVAASGDFYYMGNDTSNFGVSAIPTGWTVVVDYTIIPLTFVAREANSTVSMAKSGNAPNISLQYSTDNGVTWNTFTVGTTTVTLTNVGDEVMLKATTTNNTTSDQYTTNYNKFVISGQVDVKGNCNSLLSSNFTSVTSVPLSGNGGIGGLFYGCSGLIDASNMVLPATTVGNFGYNHTFHQCSGMTKAPEIFATDVGTRYGFGSLFDGCSNLTEIKIHYTGNFGGERTSGWVNGVSSTGTLYYNGADTTRGTNAIPTGWTVSTF